MMANYWFIDTEFLPDKRDLAKRTRAGHGADSGVSTCDETGRDRLSWSDVVTLLCRTFRINLRVPICVTADQRGCGPLVRPCSRRACRSS